MDDCVVRGNQEAPGGATWAIANVGAFASLGLFAPGLNSAIHIAGSAAILLVLLVPALEHRMQAWLSGGGRPSGAAARR